MFNPSIIRAEMARRNLTLEAVSERSGLAVSGIHKALGPNGNPTRRTMEAIASAIGVNPALFFDNDLHHSANDTSSEKQRTDSAVSPTV